MVTHLFPTLDLQDTSDKAVRGDAGVAGRVILLHGLSQSTYKWDRVTLCRTRQNGTTAVEMDVDTNGCGGPSGAVGGMGTAESSFTDHTTLEKWWSPVFNQTEITSSLGYIEYVINGHQSLHIRRRQRMPR